mmetsp:Transcript_57860/g.123038  ORF Transcript_57860/g.123038 Transcript_57860/m.123038 type:complete len:244 (-) Transcript_57860:207-938(-)
MSSNASRPRRELWSDISAEDTQGYHIPSSDDNSAIAAELDGDEEEPIAQNEPGGASASTALPEEAPCPEVQNALLPVSFSSAAAQRCNRMNRHGFCKFGNSCKYDHSSRQLRPSQKNRRQAFETLKRLVDAEPWECSQQLECLRKGNPPAYRYYLEHEASWYRCPRDVNGNIAHPWLALTPSCRAAGRWAWLCPAPFLFPIRQVDSTCSDWVCCFCFCLDGLPHPSVASFGLHPHEPHSSSRG